MIMGSYPCCGGGFLLAYDGSGFMQESCPHCGIIVWHHMSNFDPWSLTEDEFLRVYSVCEETRTISKRVCE